MISLLLLLVTSTIATNSPFRPISLDSKVELASCSVQDVEQANAGQLHQQLTALINTSFFRRFKVINEECKFWKDPIVDSHVKDDHSESCSATVDAVPACSLSGTVDNEEDKDAHTPFASNLAKAKKKSSYGFPFGTTDKEKSRTSGSTTTRNHAFTKSPITSLLDSTETDCSDPAKPNFFLDLCDPLVESTKHAKWVDLQDNPERWTGYNGSKIWAAIHDENCILDTDNDMCYEERVLRKLLSGVHASISLHIAEVS